MYPDWIIISPSGCILVEYFGLYQENIGSSERLKRYNKTMESKIIKYNELEQYGYKHLYIYPSDLRDRVSLKNKIKEL